MPDAPEQPADASTGRRRSQQWCLESWTLTVEKVLLRFCPFFHCIDRWETKEVETRKKEGKDPKPTREWDLGRAFWVIGSLLLLVTLW